MLRHGLDRALRVAMDEKDFKKHLSALAHGHHHPEEHDWGPDVHASAGAGTARAKNATATKKPAAKRAKSVSTKKKSTAKRATKSAK